MPKDPKRNIQSYQIEGGHLNEFEFQKSQGEMAEETELPFGSEANKPTTAERLEEVTAKAHRKVAKRKNLRAAGRGDRPGNAARKSAKRIARTTAKKTPARAATKKRTQVKGTSERLAKR